ncbi:MAG: sugar phosphate isomerase/epimerase [Bryobacteraceae bacterium]|nr:sugar phosphate isomerase/epimerase [Bryobacteraceae bacterium]
MNHPAEDVLREIRWMGELGFDFVDLTLEPPAAASWKLDVEAVRQALDDAGLRAVGHTAWYLPLASAIEEIRCGAVAELKRCLDVFRGLGVAWMNVHPDRHTPWHDRRFVVERNIVSLREVIAHGRECGVGVMIENLPRDFNNAAQLAEILDPLPELGLHLDIGHANLHVPANTTGEILARFGSRLRHVHLHDNRGGHEDLHLPLGAGTVDAPLHARALRDCGYDGTITLEVFTPDRRHLLYSRDALRRMWDEGE